MQGLANPNVDVVDVSDVDVANHANFDVDLVVVDRLCDAIFDVVNHDGHGIVSSHSILLILMSLVMLSLSLSLD